MPSGAATTNSTSITPSNSTLTSDEMVTVSNCCVVLNRIALEFEAAFQDAEIFVNGTRVGSAILTEDDVVTIGNVDLVFRDGKLIQLSEAAKRTDAGPDGRQDVDEGRLRQKQRGGADTDADPAQDRGHQVPSVKHPRAPFVSAATLIWDS